jgi:hypothetical protein
MSQTEGRRLDAGDILPALQLKLLGGGTLDLPPAGDRHLALLVYRGHF